MQNSVRDFEQQGIDRKLATVQQSLQDLETIKDTNLKSIQDLNTQIGNMNSELAKQQVIYVIRKLYVLSSYMPSIFLGCAYLVLKYFLIS